MSWWFWPCASCFGVIVFLYVQGLKGSVRDSQLTLNYFRQADACAVAWHPGRPHKFATTCEGPSIYVWHARRRGLIVSGAPTLLWSRLLLQRSCIEVLVAAACCSKWSDLIYSSRHVPHTTTGQGQCGHPRPLTGLLPGWRPPGGRRRHRRAARAGGR